MKYKHMVKDNGFFYPAGTEVPVGEEKTQNEETKKTSRHRKPAEK